MGGAAVSARDRILARLATALGPEGPRATAVAGWRPARPVPAMARLDGAARIDQFVAKAVAVDCTITRLGGLAELPGALGHELRQRNLPAAIRTGTEPIFAGLDWGTVDRSVGMGRVEEPASLSRAAFGLAETGTLALASGPENPVTLTFLGETHFVVLAEADVVGGFEEMWAGFRARGMDPRTLNLVTGPSRSADIGQKLQLGAHGPVAVHVFLLAGSLAEV